MPHAILITFPPEARTEADALAGQLSARNLKVALRAESDTTHDADYLIIMLTPEGFSSATVNEDAFAFYNAGKPIVCVNVHPAVPPSWLARFPRFDWRRLNYDDFIRHLSAPSPEPPHAGQPRIVISPFAPERTIPEALQALHDAVAIGGKIMLTKQQVDEIAALPPENETAYRLIRYARWSAPEFEVDERFMRLNLLIDDGDSSQRHYSPRPTSQTYQDLAEALEKGASGGALVVLGLPGAGKSTLLRRLEMEAAIALLRATPPAHPLLPFHISLADYGRNVGSPTPAPINWLAERWAERCPQLPPLQELVQQRRMLFILDGLNELPRESDVAHKRLIDAWRDFLGRFVRDMPGNRAVFACRTIDYSEALSSPDFPVPQAVLQPFTPEQVLEYLRLYAPDHAVRVWDTLRAAPDQLDLFRIPYLLRLLTDLLYKMREIPRGRAETFTQFVRMLLRRELEKRTPLFVDGPLLESMERLQIMAGGWQDTVQLPERGLAIQALRNLAFNMQQNHPGERLVALDMFAAMPMTGIDLAHQENALRAGISLNMLDYERFIVRFFHQLLQEYFAARMVAANPKPELARVEWQSAAVPSSVDETLSRLPINDPLPPLPTTGWEVTMVMAAAMANNPESFVRDLIGPNLPLAAYCAAAPDVRVSDTLKNELRMALIARMGDPAADLRARIAAGLALGELGDPRFARRQGATAPYLYPPMVAIPGGEYPIGSTEAENEGPIHTVHLAPFQLGKFPVTNGEYALFMAAGGYDDQRWWPTEGAQQWRSGQLDTEPDKAEWRQRRAKRQAELASGDLDRQYRGGEINQAQYESRKRLAMLSDAEFEAELASWYPAGRRTAPYHWDDQRFNNRLQPVVGITLFEARAYCLWLAHESGQPFRLPTEAEREAATRGMTGRSFSYGDNRHYRNGNTYETRLRRTAPIGIFPAGDTPEGLADLSGNIWEWTSSIARPYPYRPDDGREDPTPVQDYRVARGGSWYHLGDFARGAYRALYKPYHMNDNVGFRVAL